MSSLTSVNYANTVNGAADTIDFLNFFEEASNSGHPRTGRPCLDPGSIIVMDNCPTYISHFDPVLRFASNLNYYFQQ